MRHTLPRYHAGKDGRIKGKDLGAENGIVDMPDDDDQEREERLVGMGRLGRRNELAGRNRATVTGNQRIRPVEIMRNPPAMTPQYSNFCL